MAVEINDQRRQPSSVNVDLRMLRYAVQYHSGENYNLVKSHSIKIRTRSHTATSRLDIRDGKIILTQEFREGDYYNASAVAIGIVGRKSKAKSMENGQIEFVQMQSKAHGECHLRNPWPDKTVMLYRNNRKAESLSGSLLSFPTGADEIVTLTITGIKPSRKEIL